METLKNNLEAVKTYLNELGNSELVSIHNTYCQENSYPDDEIYSNDEEFFNTFFESRVIEAVRAVSYGSYGYQHDYVKFNGYGNLESFNDVSEQVDISAIATDIMENPDRYDIDLEEEETEE